jgi:hypothetical protein
VHGSHYACGLVGLVGLHFVKVGAAAGFGEEDSRPESWIRGAEIFAGVFNGSLEGLMPYEEAHDHQSPMH